MLTLRVLVLAALTLGLTACPFPPFGTTGQYSSYLAAPPAGEGVQITVGPFDVPANAEVQKNFYLKLPVDQDVAVNRIQVAYPQGSHHCNLFKSDTQDVEDHVEDTFDAIAYENYDMFAASQTGNMDWKLPDGAVIKLKARQQLIVQSHYVNAETQKTPDNKGEVKINLWFAKPDQIKHTMGMLFAINKNLDIPPKETSLATKSIDLKALGHNKDVKIAAMTGHFHSRGKTFEINRWDGVAKSEQLYFSDNWDEPPFKVYDQHIDLKAGEKLIYTTTFVNNTDKTIVFGPKVEFQEHSNLFMYFYPGPESGKAIYDVGGLP